MAMTLAVASTFCAAMAAVIVVLQGRKARRSELIRRIRGK